MEHIGISRADFDAMHKRRNTTAVAIRNKVWWWMRHTRVMESGVVPTLEEIGAVTGGYDHTTIMHSLKGRKGRKP